MLIKVGVDISRLERNTRRGLHLVSKILASYAEEIIITSTYEGNHSAGSLHYANQAFDVRIPSEAAGPIFGVVKEKLGSDWDVIDEKSHWHLEYDPK